MNAIWVDTDFGFDDLWALLLLRRMGCAVAGVSLVAGNAPLAQVAANAGGACVAYGFDWPMWQGSDRPLKRAPETAERILGPTGMLTRGLTLPDGPPPPPGALDALSDWLASGSDRTILALGPLTNIATLLQGAPNLTNKITRLVWMGGSAGRGNHTPQAEYNAFADPEALDIVLRSGVPIDIVDLEFCRAVTFSDADMPATDPLTADLLGGYLDIALTRGRPGMAIYDPLAALAVAQPDAIGFAPCEVRAITTQGDSYGATHVTPAPASHIRIAADPEPQLASLCLDVLQPETADAR